MNLSSDESNFKDKLLSNQTSTAHNTDRNPATLTVDPDVALSSQRKHKSSKQLNLILSLICLFLVCCLFIVILANLRCLNTLNCLKSSSNASLASMAITKTYSSFSNRLANQSETNHDNYMPDLSEINLSFNSKWNSSRLPLNLKPYHYIISLKIDVYNKKFTGNCTIFFKCKEKTSLLVVHSDSNLIFESIHYLPVIHETDPVNLNVTTRRLHVKSMETNLFFNYLIIELNSNETFKKTHQYSVKFENFYSEITNNLKGLYISNYNTNNGTLR